MGGGAPSNFFLIAGIVVNVVLTGLAIWWLLKQGVKHKPPDEKKGSGPFSGEGNGGKGS